ncbi:MAG: single-stranded-DNA-specific exonuclease RecJ [bacterium]|nr:MAG: single-stranded-DNA-specific exonuclease RecJ [bacterium]
MLCLSLLSAKSMNRSTPIWQIKYFSTESMKRLKNGGVSELLAKLLIQRNIKTRVDAELFLKPQLKDIESPFRFVWMQKSVERIVKAITGKEKIAVYGDYDADGITATALLVKFFRAIDVQANWYIPNRLSEGYGLNSNQIKKISSEGITLIITVDNGISSIEPIELANELGIDVIITDHHTKPDKMPSAYSIVHPDYAADKEEFPPSGAGVAFNLIIALRSYMRSIGFSNLPNLKQYIDIAALGTIADIVPLVGTNRIIVKYGLEQAAQKNSSKAISAMLNSKKNRGEISTKDIGFIVAPRINAAGRMGAAEIAMKLFLSENDNEICQYSKELNALNTKRQKLQSEILNETEEKISKLGNAKIIVAWGDWHKGIIGIVAGRIAEKYARPAIVISTSDKIATGSGRSIRNVNLFELISKTGHMLKHFGGHPQAVGLSIEKSKLDKFTYKINEAADSVAIDQTGQILYDDEIDFNQINNEFYSIIDTMKPFGNANPEPLFCSKNIVIEERRIVGNGHWKMRISQDGRIFPAIYFNAENNKEEIGRHADILWKIKKNRWAGYENLELCIEGMRNVKNSY